MWVPEIDKIPPQLLNSLTDKKSRKECTLLRDFLLDVCQKDFQPVFGTYLMAVMWHASNGNIYLIYLMQHMFIHRWNSNKITSTL